MIDSHTHCNHSPDSSFNPEVMVKEAIRLNVQYYAITDHCDYDFDYCTNCDFTLPVLDVPNHISVINDLKNKYKAFIDIACGIEVGFSKESESMYSQLIQNNSFDVIINSVHTVFNEDCYQQSFFANKTKQEAYDRYFQCILDSVYASYDYDIIGHLGYVTRKAPYDNKLFNFEDHKHLLLDILKGIIEKEKTLEINTHIHNMNCEFLPSFEVLKHYKDMGGKRITFSSDAHAPARICEKYNEIVNIAKNIGFNYFTYYKNRMEFQYKV